MEQLFQKFYSIKKFGTIIAINKFFIIYNKIKRSFDTDK